MKRVVLREDSPSEAPKSEATPVHQSQQTQQKDEEPPSTALQERRRLPHILPPEFMEIIKPSLQVGAGAGVAGVFVGAASGIIRSAPPLLFSIVAGAQCFTLGTSYYASRMVVMKGFGGDTKTLTPSDMIKASAIAGGFAGTVGGLLRGPKNIGPGAVVFALLGAGGQAVANLFEQREKETPSTPSQGFLHSRWSPVTPLSDDEYKKMLEEKLLRVEADLAVVDDNIKELRDADAKARGRANENVDTNLDSKPR